MLDVDVIYMFDLALTTQRTKAIVEVLDDTGMFDAHDMVAWDGIDWSELLRLRLADHFGMLLALKVGKSGHATECFRIMKNYAQARCYSLF